MTYLLQLVATQEKIQSPTTRQTFGVRIQSQYYKVHMLCTNSVTQFD